jgi:hypothetical protein
VAWRAGAAALALGLAGCYVHTPLYTPPAPGTHVRLELNERGRAALEQNIGPDAAAVEGVVSEVVDSQLVVAVHKVFGLHGPFVRWAGESVVFRQDYLRAVGERRYSKGRSFALASVLASGALAFVVTRSLLGGDTRSDGNLPPGDGNTGQ